MIFFGILVLNFSEPGKSKPFRLANPLLRNQTFSQKSRDHERLQFQEVSIKSDENTIQESEVTRTLDGMVSRQSAHDRTARDVNNPCISKIEWTYDKCRKMYVKKTHCHSESVACLSAIADYGKPLCVTVYGTEARFLKKCKLLPIGCQCAA